MTKYILLLLLLIGVNAPDAKSQSKTSFSPAALCNRLSELKLPPKGEAGIDPIFDAFMAAGDRNSEHYRWRAFLDFMKLQVSLDPRIGKRLYDLGANDPDGSMGGSMMAHVLRRGDCPKELLLEAAESDRKFLRKIASEKLASVGSYARNPTGAWSGLAIAVPLFAVTLASRSNAALDGCL